MAAFEHRLARARSPGSSTRSNPPSHAAHPNSSRGLPAFLQSGLARGGTPRGLTLNQPGDPFEREADHFAQSAAENPRSALRSSPPTFASGPGSPVAQLKPTGASARPIAAHSLSTSDPGDALTSDLRRRMEPLAGAGLGGVRVHSSPAARQAALSPHARAFTHQNHIWLGPGESSNDL